MRRGAPHLPGLAVPAVAFALPLVAWAGLEAPFSQPKLWLLVAAVSTLLPLALWSRRQRPGTPACAPVPPLLQATLVLWLASWAASSLAAPVVSPDALLLGVAGPLWCLTVPLSDARAAVTAAAHVAGAAAVAAVAVAQRAGADPFAWAGWVPVAAGESARLRVYATLGNPDFVGALLATSAPLGAALVLAGGSRRARALAVAGSALSAAAVAATGSRAAALGLAGGGLVLAACAAPGRFRSRVAATAVVIAAATVAFSGGRPVAETLRGRAYVWSTAWQHACEHPAAGLGPGGFELHQPEWEREARAAGRVRPGDAAFAGPQAFAHQDLLQALVERGVPGLASTVLVLATPLVLWRRTVRLRGAARALGAGAERGRRRLRHNRVPRLPAGAAGGDGRSVDGGRARVARGGGAVNGGGPVSMIDRRAERMLYVGGLVALSAALVVSAVRAQATGFEARRSEVLRQARADQQAAGLAGDANRAKLYSLHSTPELTLAKALVLEPGASAPLALAGRFEAKTTFLSQLEGVEIASPVVAANAFKATVTVAPGVPPAWATVYAFAPVSGAWSSIPAVLVGSPQAYKLSASNGWSIVLTPQARAFSVEERGRATVPYKADYYKPGGAAPFESLTGSLTLQRGGTPGSYSFSMQAGAGPAQAEVMALTQQMMPLIQAGKYDSPELSKLQAKLEAAQARMTKEMEAQNKDPSAMIRKQEEFGCGTIDLSVRGGRVAGSVGCGSKVGTLRLTGQS